MAVSQACYSDRYSGISEIFAQRNSVNRTLHRKNLASCDDRLWMFQLKIDEVAAQEEIRKICARMLGENRQIRRLGFPSGLQDLFVEQVAICGVNRFAEFLTDGTVRMIQSLQTSRGCFSLIEKGSRLSIDCYNHLSAVAAAAIATFLTL